jgi:hypothetical protein
MTFDLRKIDLDVLNSITKYPSIPTYHTLDPGNGVLGEEHVVFPPGSEVVATEKINGTNARIILTPDGQWLIGSREAWLSAKGDLIANPAEGIVDALCGMAETVLYKRQRRPVGIRVSDILVLYAEVYGDRISGWQQYVGRNRGAGFRLFDAMVLNPEDEVFRWPREKIAGWRSRGGQPFLNRNSLSVVAHQYDLPMVPLLFKVPAEQIPETLLDMQYFMSSYRATQATLDGTIGKSEGMVLRTPGRDVIAKARFEDYHRSLRRRQGASR